MKLSPLRLGTYAVGAALVALGALVPGAQAAIAVGMGVIGYAATSPADRKIIRAAKAHGVQPSGARVRPDGSVVPPPTLPPKA